MDNPQGRNAPRSEFYEVQCVGDSYFVSDEMATALPFNPSEILAVFIDILRQCLRLRRILSIVADSQFVQMTREN
jgi:hypothetical protein